MSVSSSWDANGLIICHGGKTIENFKGQKSSFDKVVVKKKKKPRINFPNVGLFAVARFK